MIQTASQFYKQVHGSMLSSTKKIIATKEILTDLEKVFLQFSKGLEAFTHCFNKQIMRQAERENERLLISSQIFNNSLIKISGVFKKLSSSVMNGVIEPFVMFIENYRDTNRRSSRKVNDSLVNVQNMKKHIQLLKVNSYQSWVKSEKTKGQVQKAIEKIQKGGKNTDLIKANDNSLKLRMAAEQQENQYKAQVIKCNQAWRQTIKQFEDLCILFQYNEQARLSFSCKTFTTALKILSESGLLQSDIQIKIKQSESVLRNITKKVPLLSTMKVKAKYKALFEVEEKQVFVAYESSRKEKEIKSSNDPYKGISLQQREEIEEILSTWLGDKQVVKLKKDFEKMRMKIIEIPIYSVYFVQMLSARVQKMPQYYCKMEEEHFNELLNVLTLITRSLEYGNQKAYQEMYKIINISMRIMKKKKEKSTAPRELLSSAIGKKSKIFANESVWMSILKQIRQKSDPKKSEVKATFSKGFAFLKQMVKWKSEQKDDNTFEYVQQIATLMSNLSVSTQFSIPLVKKLLGGREEAFELLKDVLYTKQDVQLRQRLLDPKQITQHQQNKQLAILHNKMTAVWCLKQVSRSGFLDQHDIELRLVCKFLKKTHKYILYHLNINHKWLRILGSPTRNYSQMKAQVAQNSVPPAVQEIITLDVNRSLHIHSEYLTPTILQTFLRTFAYYNKNISYCQGMNYIAGYIFIKIRNEEESYAVFERMMKNHFNELFVNEFEILKIKMYQFERIMSIFLPQVSDHFKRQMISSQCYIVSWIITLYSSTYQHCKQSYLVDYLWNRFVVWGWRQFFKLTIWIFSLYKDELVQLSFDKTLHFLSDLTKTDLFNSDYEKFKEHPKIQVDKMEEQINSFRITNKLLEQFRKDYEVAKKINLH